MCDGDVGLAVLRITYYLTIMQGVVFVAFSRASQNYK